MGLNRPVGLRPALLFTGIYSVVTGAILLFPSVSAAVFDRPVTDPAVQAGWGTSIIATGLLALGAASDVQRYGRLAPLFATGIIVVTFGLLYFWLMGGYTIRTVLVPFLINIVLIAWVWSARPKE